MADALGPEAKEAFMTTADMIEARGRTEGEARMLIKVLTGKFGPLPDTMSAKVKEASVADLETWATRAGTATTLDEVFA